MRLRLVPQETNFDFFRFRKVTFGGSIIAMLASIAIWLAVGLNFGIDFLGGTTIRADSKNPVVVAEYRDALAPLGLGDVTITEVNDPTFDEDQFVAQIRIQAQEGAESVTPETIAIVEEALGSRVGGQVLLSFTSSQSLDDVASGLVAAGTPAEVLDDTIALAEGLPLGTHDTVRAQLLEIAPDATLIDFAFEDFVFASVESVGPKVSGELIVAALLAVSASLAAILFYIWLRFEWQFSVGAIAALVHDVVLTIGIFSLLQIRFDLATIAAILTIIGYSINDTVVLFDRLRENLIKFKKTPLQEVMNRSTNETLSRTLMTSGTTLLALLALLILGGDVIRGFVFAIFWGVIVGTYSSVYVAKNVVLMLGIDRDPKKPTDAGTQFADIDA